MCLALMSLATTFGCKDTNVSVPEARPLTSALVEIPDSISVTNAATVYVCKSAGAKKYHYSSDCRGLKQCKHTIEKMEKKSAEALGLGLCGWED